MCHKIRLFNFHFKVNNNKIIIIIIIIKLVDRNNGNLFNLCHFLASSSRVGFTLRKMCHDKCRV